MAANLTRFKQAQQTLYGDIDSISDASTWTPPQNSGGHNGRYLWTDAFGVLNFLTLHQLHSLSPSTHPPKAHYLTLATRLVQTIHLTLAHTRSGHPLPGSTPSNPLGGGLRISKSSATDDGQYHHYLTLWMFALNRLSKATRNPMYNNQAIALARAIHPRFFVRGRMVWKMDVALEEVLVSGEGGLDPFAGRVVFGLLRDAALAERAEGVLGEEIADYERVIRRKGGQGVSGDMLDLGMTMWWAHWVEGEQELVERCVEMVSTGELIEKKHYLNRDITSRLAFREFGTCLGLRCLAEQESQKDRAEELKAYADAILDCWEPHVGSSSSSSDITPADLQPITQVMYAAALIPGAFCGGFFGPEPPPGQST
ncbi:hypothetical protein BO71DRAFT_413920 [Aspergillus ellipticus CBS 707.79]|uniref:L-ascorbic acid binding protein n=1 Tax=Aspergillus ellipticus CBS 707.79 TaxID=1448320 RepID=A0A319CTV3_9EURO|nr:hypothetical protein BO71DRAFT_413920 [Aspergillus ellipticus CBS 707.79]